MKRIRQLLAVFLLTLLFVFAASAALAANQTLINQTHPLTQNYVPGALVSLNSYISASSGTKLDKESAEALKRMAEDMELQGAGRLYGVSGYRTYATQVTLYRNKTNYYINCGYSTEKAKALAAQVVAVPGSSEHQSGYAIDVDSAKNPTNLTEAFNKTKEGIWLNAHCGEYGYILRYPKDKTQITGIIYEPWHFRYVGLPHSYYIMNNKLCLEEYIQLLQTNGCIHMQDPAGTDYLVYDLPDEAAADRLFWAEEAFSTPALNSPERIVTAKVNATQLWSFLLAKCPDECKNAALASVQYSRLQEVPATKLSADDGMKALLDYYLQTAGWDTVCRLTYEAALGN